MGKYWENICKIQQKQEKKGIETYGNTLENDKLLTSVEKIEYLEEELVDALIYIENIKADIAYGRHMAKEPVLKDDEWELCPVCGVYVGSRYDSISHRYEKECNYCPVCGQKIDWGRDEESNG